MKQSCGIEYSVHEHRGFCEKDKEDTKYVIPEVCRILSMKPKTEENKAHAGELGEMLKNGMTFQMPEDSEVEA